MKTKRKTPEVCGGYLTHTHTTNNTVQLNIWVVFFLRPRQWPTKHRFSDPECSPGSPARIAGQNQDACTCKKENWFIDPFQTKSSDLFCHLADTSPPNCCNESTKCCTMTEPPVPGRTKAATHPVQEVNRSTPSHLNFREGKIMRP